MVGKKAIFILQVSIMLVVQLAAFASSVSASAVEVPSEYLIEGVPHVQQDYMWCGPASLTMVLNYLGDPVTQREVGNAVDPEHDGTSTSEMLTYARNRGYMALCYRWGESAVENIKICVSHDYPVIVLQYYSTSYRRGHYRVVTGYSEEYVFVDDPYAGPSYVLSWGLFIELWSYSWNWSMIIVKDSPLDSDGDGLRDYEEASMGVDLFNPDTDGDGLLDGEEVNVYQTSPLKEDTDGDGFKDAEEVKVYGTNPSLADTDGDGISDLDEVTVYRTDATKPDTDSDGVSDKEELELGLNPLSADTDGDLLPDGDEVARGTNPLNVDSDGDGLTDGEEAFRYKSNPLSVDTDGDGWGDAVDPTPTNVLIPNSPVIIAGAVIALIVLKLAKK